VGCIPVAEYDQSAYDQAVSLKTESLTLMNKANESYSLHQIESDSLKVKVEAAFNYSANRPNNSESANQWEILKDPGRNLLFGFLERWKGKDHLSPEFISGAVSLISDAFDTIINLELNKKQFNGGLK
jgi:hypothetical protein